MAEAAATILGSWDCPSSPTLLSPTRLAEHWYSLRRGLPARHRRLVRIFSLSPLLFSFAPSADGDLMSLLGDVELASEVPHHPISLSAKQRHLIALVDQIAKDFDETLKTPPSVSDLTEFLIRFRQLPYPVYWWSVEDVIRETTVSRQLWRKLCCSRNNVPLRDNEDDEDDEGYDATRRRDVSERETDISERQITVVVFVVLSVICRVSLNPEGLFRTFELLSSQFFQVARELRDKGNRAYQDSVSDETALRTAANLYTAGVAASPFDPHLYRNRAQCYFNQGDYDVALTDALRAHILESNFKSASHLMAECLYRMGEIDAAKSVNRRASRLASSGRSIENDAIDVGHVRKQLQRWKDGERKAKDKLERALYAATSAFLARRDPLATIDAYGRVDDIVEEYGRMRLGLLNIDFAVMSYCRALSYIESGIPYYINCAIEKMEEVIGDADLMFPLAFLALGKAFKKLKLYSTARDWAKKGEDMLRRGVRMTGGCHYWPGSQILIEESQRDKLEESLGNLKTDCERFLENPTQHTSDSTIIYSI